MATPTPQVTYGTLSGVVYIDIGGFDGNIPAENYPVRFQGPAGTFDIRTDASGWFSVRLPYGTYQVIDGYADWGCMFPPEVTPATVTIDAAAETGSFVTTGCIL